MINLNPSTKKLYLENDEYWQQRQYVKNELAAKNVLNCAKLLDKFETRKVENKKDFKEEDFVKFLNKIYIKNLTESQKMIAINYGYVDTYNSSIKSILNGKSESVINKYIVTNPMSCKKE